MFGWLKAMFTEDPADVVPVARVLAARVSVGELKRRLSAWVQLRDDDDPRSAAEVGSEGDWTLLRPPESLPPCHFHELIALAAGGAPGDPVVGRSWGRGALDYMLTTSPDPDVLVGWRGDGAHMLVYVPANHVWLNDATFRARTPAVDDLYALRGLPAALREPHSGSGEAWELPVPVRPGDIRNPGMAASTDQPMSEYVRFWPHGP